jgi:AraC-like DNA-binding protein
MIGTRLRDLGKSVFVRTFVLFFLVVSVSVCTIAYISIRSSESHIAELASKYNVGLLAERLRILEQQFLDADRAVTQIIVDRDVSHLVQAPTIMRTDSITMMEVTRLVATIENANDLIAEIAFFDNDHDFVLTDTKYSKADYIDPYVLERFPIDDHLVVLRPRTVGGKLVVTFIRRFEAISGTNEGYLAVDLDYHRLFSQLSFAPGELESGFIITDTGGRRIYPPTEHETFLPAAHVDAILGSEQSQGVYRIPGGDVFVCVRPSEVLPWTMMLAQEYPLLVQSAVLLRRIITGSLVAVLIATVGIIYAFSRRLYRPLADLLVMIRRVFGDASPDEQDDYQIIDAAITALLDDKEELSAKLRRALPYLERYSVYDLVARDRSQEPVNRTLQDVSDLMGCSMRHPFYVLTVFEVENGVFDEHVRLQVEGELRRFAGEIDAVVSEQSDTRGLVLLNTSSGKERVYAVLRGLKKKLSESGTELTVSVAEPVGDTARLHGAYEQAVRQLENRFFLGRNEIIVRGVTQPVEAESSPSTARETSFIDAIREADTARARSLLGDLVDDYVGEGRHSIDYVRCLSFQLVSRIRDSLAQLGVEEEWYPMSRHDVFEDIQSTKTLDELRRYLESLIDDAAAYIRRLRDEQHGHFVSRTEQFLRDNLTRDISLEEISNAVFLSPKYLSTIFKEETGRTIFSYLTSLRMELAIHLLETENISVKKLARRVGYNNVQSFIRFFKRTYDLTPAQYRKSKTLYQPAQSRSVD